MRIKHGMKKKYQDWLDKNTDGYSRACVVYTERFADMLEIEYVKAINVPMSKILELYGDKFSHDADIEGATGFMVGVSINILSQCWEFGKDLKVWWNTKYGQPDAEGTVNPACMTIGVKE